jgi:hypothetical protein
MAQETVCSAGLKALRRSFTPSPEVDILYVESYSRDSNCIALMIEKQTQDVPLQAAQTLLHTYPQTPTNTNKLHAVTANWTPSTFKGSNKEKVERRLS